LTRQLRFRVIENECINADLFILCDVILILRCFILILDNLILILYHFILILDDMILILHHFILIFDDMILISHHLILIFDDMILISRHHILILDNINLRSLEMWSLIQIVCFWIEKAVKEVLFDVKECQIAFKKNAIKDQINVIQKETFLICLKRMIAWSIASIENIQFAVIMIWSQFQSHFHSFNVWNVVNELTIKLYYSTHAIWIDLIILWRQNDMHAVLNCLDICCFMIRVFST